MHPAIVGRSSSHFTRVVRVFAHELCVAHQFCPLHDLLSEQPADYGGNPALKLPALVTEEGSWFGALSICRELARLAPAPRLLVWPEQLTDRRAANAQELVLQGMATEVAMVMSGAGGAAGGTPYESKMRASLRGSLSWLDAHWPAVWSQLDPTRQLSFLEVTAYCFVEHLAFREVLDVGPYANLRSFCREFGRRASLCATEYRYDAVADAPV